MIKSYKWTLAMATIAIVIAIGVAVSAGTLLAASGDQKVTALHHSHTSSEALNAKIGWAPVTCAEYYRGNAEFGCYRGSADTANAGAWGNFSTSTRRARMASTLPGETYATGSQYGYIVLWLEAGCDNPVHLSGAQGTYTWQDLFQGGYRTIEGYDIGDEEGTLYVWDVGAVAIDNGLASIQRYIWTLTCCG
ncbi:MAG: hypothetical protein OXH22_03945 [Chloroflexi bacterium]|nr:hypothetical protein [Chloroflexota bacterium]